MPERVARTMRLDAFGMLYVCVSIVAGCLLGSFRRKSEAYVMPEASWRGYPRLFTEKTSSLLSEALHMLHRAKDIQERRWLQNFVQRVAQLASDLERSMLQFRSFPVVFSGHQNVQQPQQHDKQQTVPTTGQISPPPSPSFLGNRVATTTQGSVQDEVRGLGKPEVVTQPNFVSDEGDFLTRQLREERLRAPSASPEARGARDAARYTTETYSLESVGPASMKPTTPLNGGDVSLFIDKLLTTCSFLCNARVKSRRRGPERGRGQGFLSTDFGARRGSRFRRSCSRDEWGAEGRRHFCLCRWG
ncbi:hypothetical protein HPB48_001019 [Haemaphysalis longicornis]|uniref:Transmembrane protein n=1 Tax=Haemaphysalis longicornis TaxID=44386 RepID=A0A9J6G1U4_HAELO|nr:hypothetical protein HPB48_001019 [Haemaphysalis longicornis]